MAETTGKDDLKDLLGALKENAETVRTTYVAFLATAVYIWLTAESVTHEQLLNPENRISLPVIGVTLPVQGFFLVAPVLLFLFHIYFLLHVSHFAGQLAHAVKKFKADGDDWKTLVHSSMFPTAFLAPETADRMSLFLMNAVVYLSFFFSAPLILLRAQWQFLPYHDQFITLVHQCLVTLSIILSSACFFRIHWLKFRYEPVSIPWSRWILLMTWHWLTERLKFKSLEWVKRTAITFAYLAVFSIAYLSAVLSLTVLKVPETNEEMFELYNLPVAWVRLEIETIRAVKTNSRAPSEVNITDDRGRYLISEFVTRNLELPEKKLTVAPSDTLKAAYKDNPKDLLSHYKGLDLQGRDLRFGEFGNSDLTKADLRKAHLEGANFGSAQLLGANLEGAGLQGITLTDAKLDNVNLNSANLQGANLEKARLRNADLRHAHLEGADLNEAQLQGSLLFDAHLEGSSLISAQLEKSIMAMAYLEGSILRGAHLQGVTLHKAILQGADLSYHASLDATDFADADLSELNLNKNKIEHLSATVPKKRRDEFRKQLEARNHKKATVSMVYGPQRIRHSGQEQFEGYPSLSESDIFQLWKTEKDVYKPLLCWFPALITEQVEMTEKNESLFSLHEIANYVKDHCPEHSHLLPQ